MQAHPELMQQSLNMMRGMAPDQLQAAAEAAGAPPDFFSSERVEQLAAQVGSELLFRYEGQMCSGCHWRPARLEDLRARVEQLSQRRCGANVYQEMSICVG